MGGAGKTPTVIALAHLLKTIGHTPHILSRGYGAYVRKIRAVNENHSYLHVGDEPLLLSRIAPTWVGPSRTKTARAAIEAGASILLMDDGFQNGTIYKDFNFVVIDSKQGIGNGYIFPAGPLREPLKNALKKVNALVFIGENKNLEETLKGISFKAVLTPSIPLSPCRVIAFAGLGYPAKFKKTLIENAYEVVQFINFADHHPYTFLEVEKLLELAKNQKARLITTEKDFLRIPACYQKFIDYLPIRLKFQEEEKLLLLIKNLFPPPNKSL